MTIAGEDHISSVNRENCGSINKTWIYSREVRDEDL